MVQKVKFALIGAGTRWNRSYGQWFLDNKDTIELVAIADLVKEKREYHAQKHNIKQEAIFESWEPMLKYLKNQEIAGILICTSDHDHYKPAMSCLEQGYHLLLEKPIAPTPQECVDIANLAEKKNRIVLVAHVLRYAPFFNKIKDLIDKGEIGEIQSIQHTENIGYFHMAHSFVRGTWRNSKESNPIIMAKSCHDLDILMYLTDSVKCTKVASFGSLKHFIKDNAPQGAEERCSAKCSIYETCPYSIKTYLTTGGFAASVTATGELDTLEHDLKVGPYGRCVYYCDNDVCDSMSNILELENGINITFSLTAFTDKVNRTINIMGSHGQIRANMTDDIIELSKFGKGEGVYRNECIEVFYLGAENNALDGYVGHGGGDSRFLEDFKNAVTSKGKILTTVRESIQSHLIAFALEESRLNEKVIKMNEYKNKFD